ncbi:Maternal embryonic leucine zipper kinase [Gossypium arboreum]|uniref:Maternal embryonic leucine zipper kinase n=1 Tax=Gossypium arboreum TaxID=29729 RepID=A0A0B0NHD0_GOSAR|nr:Maternal embryonic leucine zipper kinase [Gossypium arboreum]
MFLYVLPVAWEPNMCCGYLSACVSSSSSYVLTYRQASSRIEGRWRLDHTINWIFGYS